MKFFWSIMNAEHSNLVHPIAPSCDKSWWSSAGWCICTNKQTTTKISIMEMPIVFTTFCIYRIEVYEDENKIKYKFFTE